LALVADGHSTAFVSVASGVDIQGESSGEAVKDFAHVAEDKAILLHIALAHMFRQSGACGLLVDEVADGLHAIADGEWLMFEEMSGLFAFFDDVIAG
jgi:hypothetical protein